MSDQSGATGSGATPPATVSETEQQHQIKNAVAQVNEARAKEATLKGKPDLAKIFRSHSQEAEAAKPVVEAAEPATPPVVAEPAKEETATTVEDPAKVAEAAPAKELEDRRAKRREELSQLAKSGWERVQQGKAEKQERESFAKQKADVEARAKQLEEEKAQIELAKKDPFAWLEKIGVPPEELARRVIKRGDPKESIEQVRAELEEFKRQQAEAVKRDEEARIQRAEEDRRAAQFQQARQNESRFLSEATVADKYPAINALYTPQEILLKAYSVINTIRAQNPDAFYEDSEIADYLEQEAAPRVQKLRGPSVAPAPKTPEPPAANQAQPEQGQKSRTLSSELQSEGTVDATAFKKLPRAKQNQIAAERLKQAMERKSAK